MAKVTKHFKNGVSCGYRYRMYPTKEQIALLNQQFGGMRFIYNHILGEAIQQYEYEKTHNLPHQKYKFSFREYKAQNPQMKWLSDLSSNSVNYEILNYQSAMNNFFRRLNENKKSGSKQPVGFPKFKCKNKDKDSFKFQTPNATEKSGIIDWKNKTVTIPKIGKVKIVPHRKFKGYCSSATVTRDNDEYYISLTLELEKPKELPKTKRSVGIDMGKKDNLMILSEGDPIKNQKYLYHNLKKLRRLQKKFSRQLSTTQMINGKSVSINSNNKEKTKKKIQHLHSYIKHARSNYIHEATINIVRNFDTIGVETLNIKGMTKNPPKKKPGTPISNRPCRSQRKGNHRSTMDAAWYKIKNCLKYKSEWYGKKFVTIDTFFPSSQICHCCGHKNTFTKDIKKYGGDYKCPNCGAKLNRDVNAAINIRERALNPKYMEDTVKAFKKEVNKIRKEKKTKGKSAVVPNVVKYYKKRKPKKNESITEKISTRQIKKLRNANKTVKPTIKVKSAKVSTKTKGRKTKTTNTNN